MYWEIIESYNRAFPTPHALITNTLFDQGYSRWGVTIHLEEYTRTATVWAKDAGDIQEFYYGRGALGVVVDALPLARFDATEITQQGKPHFAGDIILSDEVLDTQRSRHGKDRADAPRDAATGGVPNAGDGHDYP